MDGCGICLGALRRPRADLAPSPIQPVATFYFYGTLSRLRGQNCDLCSTLVEGVMHFARIFRPESTLKPEDISFECSNMYNNDPFADGLPGQSKLEAYKVLREFLEISFSFTDRPEMSKIDLQMTTSGMHALPVDAAADNSKQRAKIATDILCPALTIEEQAERCQMSIESWLGECAKKHAGRCSPPKSDVLPARFLDLGNDNLRLVDAVEARQSCPRALAGDLQYTALSHCWGQKATVMTTTVSNFTSMCSSIPFESLPKTFRDAITITRRLGLRFMWIDSLCIVQDDKGDWEKEAARMAQIYQNAFLTIAATRAPDSDGGCFFSMSETPYLWRRLNGQSRWDAKGRHGLVERVQHPMLWKPHLASRGAGSSRFARWFAVRPSHDIRELAGSGNRGDGVKDIIAAGYPLLSRAWVFQERLLSPKVVHFGLTQLAWECRGAFWAQSFVPESRGTMEEQLNQERGQSKTPGYKIQPDITHTAQDNNGSYTVRQRLQPDHLSSGKLVKPKKAYPIEKMRNMFITLMQARRPGSPSEPGSGSKDVGELARIDPAETWNTLVEEFTRLEITKEMDRLPALSGIAFSIFSPVAWCTKAPTKYLAGIWTSQLPAALYWTPISANARRPLAYRAPSFSWASIEGPIEYRQAPSSSHFFTGGQAGGSTSWKCEVVAFETKSAGIDPFGRVESGFLDLRGWTGQAIIAGVMPSLRPAGGVQCLVEQRQGQHLRRQKFYLDLPLQLREAQAAEVAVGDEVTILLLECVKRTRSDGGLYPHAYVIMALVLKPSTTVLGAWERVGLVYPADDVSIYFKGQEGIGADIGTDAGMFEHPSPWFTTKKVLRLV